MCGQGIKLIIKTGSVWLLMFIIIQFSIHRPLLKSSNLDPCSFFWGLTYISPFLSGYTKPKYNIHHAFPTIINPLIALDPHPCNAWELGA
jgi:hypothetical protein